MICLHIQGKGEQLTYWLQGEDRSQRSDIQSERQRHRAADTLDTTESGLGASISPHGSRRDLASPHSHGSSPAPVSAMTRQGSVSVSIEHHGSAPLPFSSASASNITSSLTPTVTPRKVKSPRDLNTRHHHFSFSSSPSPKPLSASNQQQQLLHPHHHSFSLSHHNVNKSGPILDNEDAAKSGSFPEGINGTQKQQNFEQQQQHQQQQSHGGKQQPLKKHYKFLMTHTKPNRSSHKPLHGDLSQSQNLETTKRPNGPLKRASRKHCVSMGDNPVSACSGSGSVPTEASTLLMDYVPLAPINGTHV